MNRRCMPHLWFLILTLFFFQNLSFAGEKPLRINGSTTVNPVASEAAEILTKERDLKIYVDTQGGSSGGISSLADQIADIGMISMPLPESSRHRYNQIDFVTTQIGLDAVALVVSIDVFEGGVQAISKEEARAIYEKKITNWKDLGGPDLSIFFYNKEPGRGTWEVFANWAYGSPKNVPQVSHAEVGGNAEARTKVATTRGSITLLSASWTLNQKGIAPLGIRTKEGNLIYPTLETVQNGRYPLIRPLNFITNKKPDGIKKEFIDFVLSSRGQEIVEKHGFVPLVQIETQ